MIPQWPPRSTIVDVLAPWLAQARWFPAAEAGQPEVIHYTSVDSEDLYRILVLAMPSGAWIHIPLAYAPHWDGPGLAATLDEGVLVDALYTPGYLREWIRATHAAGGLGLLPHQDGDAIAAAWLDEAPSARPLGQEQSNTSLLIGGEQPAIIKFFRVLVVGDHPEIEIPLALASQGFKGVPEPLGFSHMSVTGTDATAQTVCTASAAALVPDAEDGFMRMVELARTSSDPHAEVSRLGATTRELHDCLRAACGEGEPMSGGALARRIHAEARQAIVCSARLAADTHTLEQLDSFLGDLQSLGSLPPSQRVHGDYHLGQCLLSHEAWFILDFEGEPLRSLEERVAPDQRLRDVAGIIRSLDYARAVGEGSHAWYERAAKAFVAGYSPEAPTAAEALLLRAFIVEKALYEIRYEAQHRPHWEDIPYRALASELSAAEY